MMPPTTSGSVGQPRLAHFHQRVADQREMAARQDRQADDMGVLLDGGGDDFGGGQADAFVVDVHAAIAGAGGDLFGAVGMAVKPRFSHQKLQRPAQFGRQRSAPPRGSVPALRCGWTGCATRRSGARYSPKAARTIRPHSPVVAPAFAAAIEAGMMLAPEAAASAQRL